MKKIISLALTAALIGSVFAGCSGTAEPSEQVSSSSEIVSADTKSNDSNNPETLDAASNSASDSKILIVYFTAAENTEADAISEATPIIDDMGSVRVLANMIQNKVGGDLFSLQTEEKYSTEYNAVADFAKEQADSDARPTLTTHVDNIDDYDTIFIGYPAWWYDMPMAVYSFLDEYDLSGKRVIAFSTHAGSGLAGGIQSIEKEEPNAVVESNGLSISGSSVSSDSQSEVDEWLTGLGF